MGKRAALRSGVAVACLLAVSLLPGIAAPASAAVPEGARADDGVIVKLRPGASSAAVASAVDGRVLSTLSNGKAVLRSGQALDRVLGQLARDPRVEWVEPNMRYRAAVVPDDTCLSSCAGGARQWAPAKVKAPQAWDITKGSESVVVAVIDGGVDATHDDLAANIADDEVNLTGRVPDAQCIKHGTHVAGSVGAVTNNGLGVAGIGWNTMVRSYRTLYEVYDPEIDEFVCTGSTAAIAHAIDLAVASGVKVVNLSLSSSFDSRTMRESIDAAVDRGVVVVAAAGNSGGVNAPNDVQFPAAYPAVISVAASTEQDRTAPYSQRGAWVDMAAPGDWIVSTVPTDNYGPMQGTSMAAPHVAAAAALVFAHAPGISGPAVADRLQRFSDPYQGSATDVRYGRLNVAAALTANEARPWVNGPGYWMVATDGGIFSFGDSRFYGSTGSLQLNQPILGMTTTSRRNGYWFVASDGGIFTFGTAGFYGSLGGSRLPAPIVGMAATPTGFGYWLAGADGSVYPFGDADSLGMIGNKERPAPIVGIAAAPAGAGYWLVAADGEVYPFGAAMSFGSMGGTPLNRPIVGMTPTATGRGYWLVADDGGIFAFGDASFHGSTGGMRLNKPIVGLRVAPAGDGYWLVASDGGIFAFNVPFFGSMGGTPLNKPVVGMS